MDAGVRSRNIPGRIEPPTHLPDKRVKRVYIASNLYLYRMDDSTLEKLKYPVGHFVVPREIGDVQLADWIARLEALPVALEDLVLNLSEEQLNTAYRPGGWTVRQLLHHIADSHHNSYIRFKWGLTEDRPLIKAYDEKAWASLFDSRTAPIALSLDHLKAVHAKLVFLLKGLKTEDLQRTFIHPETKAETSLAENVGRYAWHGSHHYAHIRNLLIREGWIVSDEVSPV